MTKDSISLALGLRSLPKQVIDDIEESVKWVVENTSSNVSGENNPFFGKKHTLETKKIISNSQIGNKKRLGKQHSLEAKKKISEGTIKRFENQTEKDNISKKLKGRKLSEETKLKMSAVRKGVNKSEEHKRKISESNINAEKIECVHCGKQMHRGLHNRWHGDNCRYLNGAGK